VNLRDILINVVSPFKLREVSGVRPSVGEAGSTGEAGRCPTP
jgi:hypothetical protein